MSALNRELRAPLRQIRTVCARFCAGGSACTLKQLAPGNPVSTLRGTSAVPMPAAAQPSNAW
jgi:hypothetical protein